MQNTQKCSSAQQSGIGKSEGGKQIGAKPKKSKQAGSVSKQARRKGESGRSVACTAASKVRSVAHPRAQIAKRRSNADACWEDLTHHPHSRKPSMPAAAAAGLPSSTKRNNRRNLRCKAGGERSILKAQSKSLDMKAGP